MKYTRTSRITIAARLAPILLVLITTAVSAGPSRVYDLGTLGGTTSEGYSVNSNGQVAGQSRLASGRLDAFLYTGVPGSGGTMLDLGTLGGAYNSGSFAGAINSSGQLAGASSVSFPYRAFLYSGVPGHGGTMYNLGTLGGNASLAYGLNDNGQVVGVSESLGGGADHAFLYSGIPGNGGKMVDLGTLGGSLSEAHGITSNGRLITGFSQTTTQNSFYHAFLYSGVPGNGGVMVDLGTLGGTISYGLGINENGQISGKSTNGAGRYHAFLYSGVPGNGGKMFDLGTLGGNESYGWGINNYGQTVGASFISGNLVQHAFVYTGMPGAGGKMTDLDAWLKTNDPVDGGKWTLNVAQGITDTGLITGSGTYNNGTSSTTHAFLLDASSLLVPEPSGILLCAMAVAAIGDRHLLRSRRS